MTQPLAFLIASPRSGTTWLQAALNAHPDVACIEQRLFGMHADFVNDAGADRPRLRVTTDLYADALSLHLAPGVSRSRTDEGLNELLASISGAVVDRVRAWSNARVVVDKITPYTGTSRDVVAKLGRLFPEAPVVHLIRDGRDVAVSGVMHWLTKALDGNDETDAHAKRRAWLLEGIGEARPDRLFLPGEIEEWGRTWSEPSRAMCLRIDAGDALLVRYEGMLVDHCAELTRVLNHVGVDPTPSSVRACCEASSFERMSGGRTRGHDRPGAHVRKGIAGDWRNWFTRADGELFQSVVGDTLQRFGYEQSERWWADLPESLAERVPTEQGVNA